MNTYKRLTAGALAAVIMGLFAAPLNAQLPSHLRDYPLAQQQTSGDLVAPFFDGWIKNSDGSVTMVYGFMNRNTKELVDIPLGSNNYIEPAQFDGAQPTHFPVYNRRGFVGIRERGAFAVTLPADMAGTEVVWTLTHAGHSYSIPGRATSTAYEMSRLPRAEGSMLPAIRFDMDGPESVDREGIYAPLVTTTVGTSVTLSAFMQDRGERRDYELDSDFFPLGTEWILHQGPAMPDFEHAKVSGRDRRGEEGEESMSSRGDWSDTETQVSFPEPGDYIIRLRVDNFTAPDSQFDNHCCWSNAYVPVKVTP